MAVTTKKTFNAVGTGGQGTTEFGPIGIELNNQDDLDVYVTLSGSNDRVLQLKQSTASTADSNHPQVNDTTRLYFPAVASGTSLTNYTISADNNNIIFNSALPSGAIVSIERRTRDGSGDYTSFSGGSTIRSTDLNTAFDELRFTAQEARNKAFDLENTYNHYGTGNVSVNAGKKIIFEGATEDAYETELTVVDPTADRTISFPNSTGTLITTGDTNSVTSAMITDGTIVDADINASAAIAQTKVALDADLTALSSCQTGGAAALAALTEAEVQILDGATVTTNELNILDGVTATKDEINIIDGVTATTAELNYVDGVTSNVQTQLDAKQASDAELTELATMASDTASALADLTQAEVQILDGATVTTTELNKLDGVTASATNLNIVDGMTKQTTISDQDTSYPTSGAVVDYVAAQIAPIGGLEVIATDAAFPNTQPAAGVVISIADAGGLVVNGSGVSTTGRTVGASTVTINGINSSFHSTTIDAGIGMLVTSTGSGQIYDYHKTVIKESDVAQISDDINDFNSRYRIAGSAPGSNNDEGDLYFDTGTNKMYVYDGSSWGEVTSTGDFKYLTLCAFNTGTGNAAVFNGSISKYDLRENSTSGSLASVTSAAQLTVSVNGVVQKPNTGTSIGSNDGFCLVDGHTIEFGANIPSSSEVFVVQSGSALSINVPGDSTVTEAKLNLSGGSNGEFLKKDSTAGGGFVWGSVPAGVGGATGVTFNDDTAVKLGTSGEAELYHNASGITVLRNTIDGADLNFSVKQNSDIVFDANDTGNHKAAVFKWSDDATPVSSAELYYSNSKKLETTNTGVTITGTATATTFTGALSGNADSATNVALTDESSDTTCFPLFATAATGNQAPKTGSNLTFNSNTGALGATSFTGDGSALTGVDSSKANGCIWENDQTISDDYTIASGKGAHSVGPITVNATVTVNGNWVVS